DATIAELDDLFFAVLYQQVVIDAFWPEFIFDDSNTPAVILGKNALEQRGFTRAQVTGKDGYRNHFICLISGFHLVPREREPDISLPPGKACLGEVFYR